MCTSMMMQNDIMEVQPIELVRKQIYITPAHYSAIKQLAQQQKTTEAKIFRKALDEFLVGIAILETRDPFAELIGMFEGPLQVNHDDVYQ